MLGQKLLFKIGEVIHCPKCLKALYHVTQNIYVGTKVEHWMFEGIGIPSPQPRFPRLCPYCFIEMCVPYRNLDSMVSFQSRIDLARKIFNANAKMDQKKAEEMMKTILWGLQGSMFTRNGWVPSNPHPKVTHKKIVLNEKARQK